jgi:hypothetical protein
MDSACSPPPYNQDPLPNSDDSAVVVAYGANLAVVAEILRCRPWILLEELAEERLQLSPPIRQNPLQSFMLCLSCPMVSWKALHPTAKQQTRERQSSAKQGRAPTAAPGVTAAKRWRSNGDGAAEQLGPSASFSFSLFSVASFLLVEEPCQNFISVARAHDNRATVQRNSKAQRP